MDIFRTLAPLFADSRTIVAVSAAIILIAIFYGFRYATIAGVVREDAQRVDNVMAGLAEATPAALKDALATGKESAISRAVQRAADECIEFGRRYRATTLSLEELRPGKILGLYGNLLQYEAAPNVLIGIGLFITFLGLATALSAASGGATSGDLEIVKASVGQLLSLASFKFVSSVVALFTSLVLGVILRASRHALERALAEVEVRFQATFPRVSVEELTLFAASPAMMEQRAATIAIAIVTAMPRAEWYRALHGNVAAIRADAERQALALENFTSDISEQLAKSLDNAITPMLGRAIERMETALRDIGGVMNQSNESALRDLLTEFIVQLKGSTESDAQQMQAALRSMSEMLSNTTSLLTQRIDDLFAGMQNAATEFGATLAASSTSFRRDVQLAQSDMTTGLADTVGRLASQTEAMQTRMLEFASRFEAGGDRFASLIDAGASRFAAQLGDSSGSLETTVARLAGDLSVFGQLAREMGTRGEGSMRALDERIAQLRSAVGEASAAFSEARGSAEVFGRTADQIGSALATMRASQTSLSENYTRLAEAVLATQRSADGLASKTDEHVQRVTDVFGEASERLAATMKASSELAELSNRRMLQAVETSLGEYETRFAGIDRDLNKAFEIVIDRFTTTYDEMHRRIDQVDHEMASAVNHLASFSENLDEHLEVLVDSVDKITRNLAKAG